MSKKKKILLIINPCAGTKKANKYMVDIIGIFCKAGYTVITAVTSCQGDGRNIVMENNEDVDIIVAVGGDGTLNEVVSGVVASGKHTPIGYIPAGSTNDFANSLGLSKDIVKATEDIVAGEVQVFDAGEFNGRVFTYVASFGVFTKTSYSVPQGLKNNLGHVAYLLAGVKELAEIKKEHLVIKIDGRVYEDDYLFGAISNSTSMGGILKLNEKDVDMKDGLFEVLLIKAPKNIIDMNKIVWGILTSNYSGASGVIEFTEAKHIEIAGSDIPWTVDGEYQVGNEKVCIKNLNGAYKLISPK